MDAETDAALEAARSMPQGSDKVEALKKAGLMRTAADASGIAFEAWQAAQAVNSDAGPCHSPN
jgi:hypothetical protein